MKFWLNRWYVWTGLIIYAFILITTFVDALEVFDLFAPQNARWSAFGVAVGFDVLVLYYSVLSVLKPSKETRFASYLGGALLWFIIFSSMVDLWRFIDNPRITGQFIVGAILSLFIPLGSFLLGRVIGASLKYDSSQDRNNSGIPEFIQSLPKEIQDKAIKIYLSQNMESKDEV